jgi:hypothetical protein
MARPKGSENKENKAIKDMIRVALSRKGGADYFERQADENPASFMTLVGKLIPAEVDATLAGNITINWNLPKTGLDE